MIVLKEGTIILHGKPDDVFKQEALLKSSNLELPFELRVYHALEKEQARNPKLLEALWAFNSKM